MSPRPGGEADKFGNRYEGRWTIRHVLYVLRGQADWIRVEETGEIGKGVEFRLRRDGIDEVHQVKRQIGNYDAWTVQALGRAKVLDAVRRHVEAGREFHFVSTVPARSLDELTARARSTPSAQSFVAEMTKDLQPDFLYLSGSDVFGSSEAAWKVLRGTNVRWPDERDVREMNRSLAETLLEGAESAELAAVGLGDLLLNNLNEHLDADTLEARMERYGLRRSRLAGSQSLVSSVRSSLLRWKSAIERDLLTPAIPREETKTAWDRLSEERQLFVVGAAGGGKSAVLHDVVCQAESAGWTVLAMRLDQAEPFTSSISLGQRLDLGVSPVSALAAANSGTPSLLVIDQLDAVSMASGRMPESFDVIADLMREARAFPEMRVILACRKFDVDNDERIRAVLQASDRPPVEVGPLTEAQINTAVDAMGIASNILTNHQRTLLGAPLNLVLLSTVADQTDALSFGSSRDLLDAYWDRKLRDCRRDRSPAPRFNAVIQVLANAMSDQQRLAVPRAVLDQDDLADDARILESEHILVRNGRQYSFFHEMFFDYAFARQWVARGQSLAEFLHGNEQELFRRGQVRQILAHLHDDDPDRFTEEAEELLLDEGIRFHIKDAVLAVLRALPVPTSDEWAMVKRVMEAEPGLVERLWLMVRTLPWFDRLDAEGEFARGLSGTPNEQERAMNVALGGIKERPDKMATLIAPYAGTSNYPVWLRWITRFADLHTSRALMDLVVKAVRCGDYADSTREPWDSAYTLAPNEPTWAIELLAAYLYDQPGAFNLDDSGRVALLASCSEHAAIQLTMEAAKAAPQTYCRSVLPYILKVMKLTEIDPATRPVRSRQFSAHRRKRGAASLYELEHALLEGVGTSLRLLIAQGQEAVGPFLDSLAADPHETAQCLLYNAMEGAGPTYAERAAAILLEGTHRLVGGHATIEHARHLLIAISPHVSDDTFAILEKLVLRLRVAWESRPHIGWSQFNLLSALHEPRLSEGGARRLGELRRLLNMDEPPEEPILTGGTVGPPIAPSSAKFMTDNQWLRAIAKYDGAKEDWTKLRGGAHELSGVLKEMTAAHPERFAKLSLRMTSETEPAYLDGILLGLGDASEACPPESIFDAVRHIISLGHSENDRWLPWPLRRYLDGPIPDDIVELLIDRALHGDSPIEDYGQEQDDGRPEPYDRIVFNGINSARGTCADLLGDLVIHDADGHRTSLVVPSLSDLASDPSLAVRSCVAHLIGACLRYARPAAEEAFQTLIQTDDRLLGTDRVVNLVVYISQSNRTLAVSVIRRMLSSRFAEVRRAGGTLAAFVGLELEQPELLVEARSSTDVATRKGVAAVCASRITHTRDLSAATATLEELANDADEEVRKAVTGVAAALRGRELRPFKGTLLAIIDSPSFQHAVTQVLFTLDEAPDRIGDLVIACATRFLDSHGADVGNLATSSAGSSARVGKLVLRAYSQSRTTSDRGAALDLIDRLLLLAAYGVDEAVNAAER